MKKILVSVVFFSAAYFASAQKEVVNDPNAEVRTISGSFDKIKVSGGIELFISQSDDEAVAVSASEDKYKENIKTVVSDNTLKIYYFNGKMWDGIRNKHLRVYVSFKNLQSIDASGACDVQVAGVINESGLSITLSGASQFQGAVKLADLRLDLSGASDLTIKGIANTVKIESTGASDVKGYELAADVCNAKASGASDVHITVNKELYANASGASDILYKGEAVIKEVHSSGASNVGKKG
ncbi:MAG: DUF2807 domain-containing protein [Bacteroidetes bacterium]|nr:DUF2807 domain-containing protein [Bacteroidota bacterium]